MSVRSEIEYLVRAIYDARLGEDLDALCNAFSDQAVFHIAGAGQVGPISNMAAGVGEFRPLLASMIKAFKLRDHAISAMLIDGSRAAVHWRSAIYSRVTGATVLTEFIDLLEFNDAKVVSYTEFFVPRLWDATNVRR